MASTAKAPDPLKHPVSKYARDVVEGRIPAGRLVRLACKRHLKDLNNKRKGYYFDCAAADDAIEFIGFLYHYKGEWAGRPIVLDPWQKFIVGSLFGWMRADGTRRFRHAYIEIPRKNGKSTLAAAIALYMLIADGEPGAEVYSAATKRDQAKIVFKAAKAMLRQAPAGLKRLVEVKTNVIEVPALDGEFLPLGRDADLMDGLNVHCAIIDELHAHKTRDVVDVLDTGKGSRREPLIFRITTAGTDPHGVCRQEHDYSVTVLEARYRNKASDAWFAYIAGTDKEDRALGTKRRPWWAQEAVWRKANPGYGRHVKKADLEELALKAIASPGSRGSFLTKRLDYWTRVGERWLDMDLWAKGSEPFDEALLEGRECYGGLDLAKEHDLSGLVLAFPPDDDDEYWRLITRAWCPEEDIDERGKRDRVPYAEWRDEEYLTATPGNATDFRQVETDIVALAERFDIREIAFDRFLAANLVQNLGEEGLTMVPFGQGFVSMAGPTAEFGRLVRKAGLRHGGHPVLTWCAGNVVCAKDPAGNLKPDKAKSTERIDLIVAAIMAIARATALDDSDVVSGIEVLTV